MSSVKGSVLRFNRDVKYRILVTVSWDYLKDGDETGQNVKLIQKLDVISKGKGTWSNLVVSLTNDRMR